MYERMLLLVLIILIPSSLATSLSQPLLYNSSVYTITLNLSITPHATIVDGYSVIEYSGLPDHVYQYYLPDSEAIPLLKLIVLLPIGSQLLGVETSYSDLEEIVLEKPLLELPSLKLIGYGESIKVNSGVGVDSVFDSTHTWYMMYVWRGVPYVSLMINPAIHNGNKVKVVVYREVSITIKYAIEKKHQPYSQLTYSILASQAYHVEPLSLSNPVLESSNNILLIITRPMFLGVLNDYVELRKKQGFNVIVKTVEDIVNSGVSGRDIPEKIRNYIYSLYTQTNGGLKYLLIIGDVCGDIGYPNGPDDIGDLQSWEVPTRYFYNPDGTGQYSHTGYYTPSDWYYAALDTNWDGDGDGVYGEDGDGEDWAPELPVGRLPFRTVDELESYIDAIARYNRSGIGKWLLTGAIVFYFNEDYQGDWGIQGDTSSEAMWLTLKDNSALQETEAIRLYEHYPVLSIVDSPSDLNGNLSTEKMVETIYGRKPDLVTWFSHGWPHIAWRVLWISDDGDGVPESEELVRKEFLRTENLTSSYGHVAGLFIAMSCLTAVYDANDELKNMFGMPDIDGLGEKLVKTTSLWYIGWDRVTFDWPYSWDEQIDPETWVLSSGLVYHVVKYLVSDSSNTRYDIGYSLASAKTWLGSPYMWESDKKVWWASTLLGDPSQLIGHANTKVTLYNDTDFTVIIGKKIRLYIRLTDYNENPLAGEKVKLYLLNTSEVIDEAVTDSEGYAVLEWTPEEEGVYLLQVRHPLTDNTMPSYSDTIRVHVITNTLDIVPVEGPSKLWVTVYGGGFTPNTRVDIYFDNTPVSTTHSDSNGYIKTCIQIPVVRPGDYTVKAIDEYGIIAKGSYRVIEPSIVLSSYNLSIGDRLVVEAAGLGNNQYYLLTIDSLVVAHILTNETGGFHIEIIVPSLETSSHNLSIVQNTIALAHIKPVPYTEIASTTFYVYNGVASKSDIDKLRIEVIETIENLKALFNTTIASLNTTITVIRDKLDYVYNRLDTMNTTVEQYFNKVDSLLDELSSRISSVEEILGSISEDIGSLETNIEDTITRLSLLNNTLLDTIQRVDTLYNTLVVLEDRVYSINSTLAEDIHDALESLVSLNNTLTSLYNTLNNSLSTLGEKVDSMKKDLGTLEASYSGLENRVDKLNKTMASSSELESLKDTVKNLENTVNSLYGALVGLVALFIVSIAISLYGLRKR